MSVYNNLKTHAPSISTFSCNPKTFIIKPLTAMLLGALALQAQTADASIQLGSLNTGNTNNTYFSFVNAVSADGSKVE